MKKVKFLLLIIIVTIAIQFIVTGLGMEPGELKVPKIPIEELLKMDHVDARIYLSNADNYNYHNGLTKVFYAITASPKYFFINSLVTLLTIFIGMLIHKFYIGKRNGT